ncbi:MAG: HAD hydrolase family protein [Actinomycetia bacterium]|nr:HAD hydrolase family protein [Actinomycetes bacterium]
MKLIILDVDGTLTDGSLFFDSNGNETKRFNVKDGFAIRQALENGLEVVLITGRKSDSVQIRAQELCLTHVYQGVDNKLEKAQELIDLLSFKWEECAVIGDDLNDMRLMLKAGFSACPKDAANEIYQLSDFKSNYCGGRGAVREIIEHILKSAGLWNKTLAKYTGECL